MTVLRDHRIITAFASSLLLLACGKEVPAGGVKAPLDRSPISRRVDPEELLPKDLDLSVRIDLGRLRGSLGPTPRDLIGEQLGADPLLSKALQHARIVTIGMRISDLELGDKVIALEGDMRGLDIDTGAFRDEKMSNDRVRFYVRRDDAARDDVGAIIALDKRALVFVSPVEVDAVKRVLGAGPDERRPDPSADGVMSVDFHPRRLSKSLERRFPSVGRIVAELESVRGTVEVQDNGIAIDLTFMARGEAAANHVRRFIEVLRDNTVDTGLSALLRNIDIDAASSTLHVKWLLPADIVARALIAQKRAAAATSEPEAPAPAATGPTSPPAIDTPAHEPEPKERSKTFTPLPAPTEGLRLSPPPLLDPPHPSNRDERAPEKAPANRSRHGAS